MYGKFGQLGSLHLMDGWEGSLGVMDKEMKGHLVFQGQDWGDRYGEYGQDVKDWLQGMLDMDRIRPLGWLNMDRMGQNGQDWETMLVNRNRIGVLGLVNLDRM